MNIFLPYESFKKCAESLDDRRLNKQILECAQIVTMITNKEKDSRYRNSYLHHPVVKHYFDQVHHIVEYGLEMCREYTYRFNKHHASQIALINNMRLFSGEFKPIFVKGSINDPSNVRETNPEKVYALFKARLLEKWKQDVQKGKSPKWTNRNKPDFIKGETL